MRVFKTAKFSKDAKKTRIADADLCTAMQEVMEGLGGGVKSCITTFAMVYRATCAFLVSTGGYFLARNF